MLCILLRKAQHRAYAKRSNTYKYLRNTLKKLVLKNKRKFVERTVNNVSNGSANWWQNIKKLNGKQKATPDHTFIDGKWHNNNSLATKLNSFFATVGGKCKPFTVEPCDKSSSRQTSIGLVKAALYKIKPGKATNSDDYPAWITKQCAEVLCIPLTNIINKMLIQQRFR